MIDYSTEEKFAKSTLEFTKEKKEIYLFRFGGKNYRPRLSLIRCIFNKNQLVLFYLNDNISERYYTSSEYVELLKIVYRYYINGAISKIIVY